MELKSREQEICIPKVLLDAFDEQPVDCDFVLPEYCPEIASVLKCTMEPIVGGSNRSGDRLLVDGTVWIRVLYLDASHSCVHRYEGSQPFTASFALSEGSGKAAIALSAKTDYVNCRAVGPRRLDVHGAFRVRARVTDGQSVRVLSEMAEEGIHTRRRELCCSVPETSAMKSFTINEVLEPGGTGELYEVVGCETTVVSDESKVLLGKLIVKGTLCVRTLYLKTENGALDAAVHELPFSQILDVEGINEQSTVDVKISVQSADIRIVDSDVAGTKLLQLNAKLLLCVQSWKQETYTVVTDAYSTRCPLHAQRVPLAAERFLGIRSKIETVKLTLDLPKDDIISVPAVWCTASLQDSRTEEEQHVADCRLVIGMLAGDGEGRIAYYERPSDVTLSWACEGEEETETPEVIRYEYSVSPDGKLEVRAELCIKRYCRAQSRTEPICAVSLAENECFPPETAAVKVVFATAGESVWDIARDCRTAVEAVIEENGLTADILAQDTMLLVPIC